VTTSIRSNAQPSGGVTAQQPVNPAIAPADIQALVAELTPTAERFRAQSSPLSVQLDNGTLVPGGAGGTLQTRIASVGLGYRVVTQHVVVISLVNTAAGAVVVNLSNFFPYNLLQNTQVQINGGATVYSASGLGGLWVAMRNKRGVFDLTSQGGFGFGLSPALVRVAFNANGTPTNAALAGNFSGIASVSCAAALTTTITVTFYTIEKFALDRESLLGALPLQNNSTFANMTRQVLATPLQAGPNNHKAPLFTAGAVPATLTASLTYTVSSTYDFMSVPADQGLYQEMVFNSYQVQEQTNLTVNATGAGALSYDIPQNQYLVAAHMTLFDSAGNLVPVGDAGLSLLKLQYNAGGVIPVQQFAGRMRAAQFIDYGDDRNWLGGYRFWDGEDTTEHIARADQMGWIDTYAAATPQLVADVAAGITTPITFNVCRESVVAGAVQVVGG